MMSIKAQIRKLDLLTQVKLFIAILKILEEPRIKRMISFDEFLIKEEYQNILISEVLDYGVEKFYDRISNNNNIDSYTIDQKNLLFFKLFM